MRGKSVGLVTYSESPNLTDSDVLLRQPLERNGYTVTAVPWGSQNVQWETFDTLILRSCWNYHQKLTEFTEWLTLIEQKGITLWNPYAVVRWNMQKTYLLELEQKGFPIIPTSVVKQSSPISLQEIFEETQYQEIVVKPIIGASAYGVMKIDKGEAEKSQKSFEELLSHSGYLIQPLMKEIYEGELSMVFIGKKYSHTILKHPQRNEYRTYSQLRRMVEVYTPNNDIISQARRVVESIPDDLLYARADGIMVNKKFMLMELELIEPDLFFDLYPQGADVFTETFISLMRDA